MTRASRSTAWAPGSSLPRRLAAKNEGAAGWRIDPVGRVGLAALELADLKRTSEASDMIRHPSFERGDVEAQPLAYLAGTAIGFGAIHGLGLRRLAPGSNPRLGQAMSEITDFDLDEFVRRVLAEDLGTGGDVTSNATISADARFTAAMNCREPIVVAGLEIAIAFFRALDPDVGSRSWSSDGEAVPAGTVLLRLDGKARAMLTAERSALNTLQHLSGIATLTRRYVDAIAGTGATLLDTRKTIPGLRAARKICGADGRCAKPSDAAR